MITLAKVHGEENTFMVRLAHQYGIGEDVELSMGAKVDMNKLQESRMQAAAHAGEEHAQKTMPVHADRKIGRNDPCPCGSGKKYKNCHGKDL